MHFSEKGYGCVALQRVMTCASRERRFSLAYSRFPRRERGHGSFTCMVHCLILGVSNWSPVSHDCFSMTFGFGRDTDTVNGWDDNSSFSDHTMQYPIVPRLGRNGDSSANSSITHHARNHHHHRGRVRSEETESDESVWDCHPRFSPGSVRCSYCHTVGHSLHNCFQRMKHHHEMMRTHCANGFHKPHLHDQVNIWRCEWCLMHLYSSYVKKHYPEHWKYEPRKVIAQREKIAKYSDIPPDFKA